MALSHPLSATRAATSLLAAIVMAVAIATPACAQASTTTTTTTTVPATTTTTTGPATSTTTAASTTTTAPHGPPTTLVDPKKLSGLLKSLNADLARMNAIQAFALAKKKAAAVAAGGPAAALSTTIGDAAATAAVVAADADLVRAAAAQLAAASAKKAAEVSVISARHRLHELAVAYYVHADVGAGSQARASDGTASPDGSVIMGLLLPQERDQLSRASHDLTKAAKDQVSSKAHADQLVAVRVAAALAQARLLAAEATTTTTTTVPAATTGTGPAATTRPPSPYAGAGLSILGPPAVTAAELAAWYSSTGRTAATTLPIAGLTALYQASGVTYGVRDDIAFTQSIIETGYFGFPAGGQEHPNNNNFAGIGACDSCAGGNQFPDAKSGVDAQLQLLQHYAGSQPMPGPLALTAGPTGCCPTWMALTGVWASNPNYGFQILTLYRHILEWVLPRRSATAGL